MNATRKNLMTEAARKFRNYLASGIQGFFVQGWDRLTAAGFDVALRSEANEQNARALLWIAENRG